jgi:circadian clock protein KaiB
MSKRILVIDDDLSIRQSFAIALENTGYLIETAESGEAGIEKTGKGKYDLIYLDLRMPGLNGAETLRELRKIDKDVPIYIITGFYGEYFHGLQEATKEGIGFEVLKKPVGGDQIAAITRDMLKGVESIQQGGKSMYQLRLHIVDTTRNSTQAIQELEALLEAKFKGQYSLEIIDVLTNPELAEVDKVLATPTVIKLAPGPKTRIVGGLSDHEKVLDGLGL